MTIEKIIIRNIIQNEPYTRKVIPYLKKSYFELDNRVLFEETVKYVAKYNKKPTREALELAINESNFHDNDKSSAKLALDDVFQPVDNEQSEEWLLDETEKWIKLRAMTLAIFECVDIVEGRTKKYTSESMPSIMQEAINTGFTKSIGHNYFDDVNERYNVYIGKGTDVERIPFSINNFNIATNGGVETKTLNMIVGGTGGGKSLVMCSLGADYLKRGYDVLYITLELADIKVAQRFDANLMNINLNDIAAIGEESYKDRLSTIKSKTDGRVIIKEYASTSVNSNHIRALLDELKLKKNFVPKIIFIDYLNLLASSRLNANTDSYNRMKSIAEEVRSVAKEYNVCIWSASQTNRAGFKKSDLDAEDTSESFGVPATADFMIGLYSDEDMNKQNKMLISQMSKNRYEDINKLKQFFVGCERAKMKLYDLERDKF